MRLTTKRTSKRARKRVVMMNPTPTAPTQFLRLVVRVPAGRDSDVRAVVAAVVAEAVVAADLSRAVETTNPEVLKRKGCVLSTQPFLYCQRRCWEDVLSFLTEREHDR
jgi:hypothetical protein